MSAKCGVCGGAASPVWVTPSAAQASCQDCGTSGPKRGSLAESVTAWNRMWGGHGPGDATRRLMLALSKKQAEAVKTTMEYELTVYPSPWGGREITYETVSSALRECGMEPAS